MHGELADFTASVVDVPELRSVLRNPQVDPRTKSLILDDLLGDADELVRNFLRLAADKGRIGAIEEITRERVVVTPSNRRITQAAGAPGFSRRASKRTLLAWPRFRSR